MDQSTWLPHEKVPYYNVVLFLFYLDESTRVHISPVRGVEGSDYINASFIDVSINFYLI